jgi:transcriptional regulator with XRE-family HTH domain
MTDRATKQDLAQRIGGRVRRLRDEAGLTLKDLAAAAGVSAPFLSRLENGLSLASIPTLQGLADALQVDIESLFQKADRRPYTVSRIGKRRVAHRIKSPEDRPLYEMELLAEGMDSPLMEPALVTILSRKVSPTTHGGQEFCYVLEGRVEVLLGSERLVLGPGDAAYWDGRLPHGAKTLNVHLVPGRRSGSFEG